MNRDTAEEDQGLSGATATTATATATTAATSSAGGPPSRQASSTSHSRQASSTSHSSPHHQQQTQQHQQQDRRRHNNINSKIDTIIVITMMIMITEGQEVVVVTEAMIIEAVVVDDLVEFDPVEVHPENKNEDDNAVVIAIVEVLPIVRTPVGVTIHMMRILDLGVEIRTTVVVVAVMTQSNTKQTWEKIKNHHQQVPTTSSRERSRETNKGSRERSGSDRRDSGQRGSGGGGSRDRSRGSGGSGGRKRRRGGDYYYYHDYYDNYERGDYRDYRRHTHTRPRRRRYNSKRNSYHSVYYYDDQYSSDSHSSSSSPSSSSDESANDNIEGGRRRHDEAESAYTKDQRTVFVSQLVMRATERDIKKYFKKTVGCKVNEVILLKDKRTGSHKGCAYVQFGRIEDVGRAVGVSGQAPDFQRFPILVKGSEAEKNYSVPASSSVVTASMMGTTPSKALLLDASGKQIESQKVYVGGLDPSVTDEHLFAIFSQFGQLEKVSMQMDPVTNASRGYAFLSFHDPKDANLAIQTMANQVLAGRPLKTGWANQSSSIPGVSIVTSDELPPDGNERAQKAFAVVGQLMGVSSEASVNATALSTTAEKAIDAAMGMAEASVDESVAPGGDKNSATDSMTQAVSASAVPTVADARASIAESLAAKESAVAAAAVTAALNPAVTATKLIGGAENPTCHLLVHNMYNKDEEAEQGWEKDIKKEFIEEVSKFGKVLQATVMHQEPGGKIYVSFETIDGAKTCADNLAGRWFDKRQLRVDFLEENELPTIDTNKDNATS